MIHDLYHHSVHQFICDCQVLLSTVLLWNIIFRHYLMHNILQSSLFCCQLLRPRIKSSVYILLSEIDAFLPLTFLFDTLWLIASVAKRDEKKFPIQRLCTEVLHSPLFVFTIILVNILVHEHCLHISWLVKSETCLSRPSARINGPKGEVFY